MSFQFKDLCVQILGQNIVDRASLTIAKGEIHALMGPNGSGKSTLAYALSGHPSYTITSGDILLDGVSLIDAAPHERAQAGLFLSFQYPAEIAGVSVQNFLRTAYSSLHGAPTDVMEFNKKIHEEMKTLGIPSSFAARSVNEGFSGGEKKRLEMLQLSILEPKYAILDETDSGLDVDALKLVAQSAMRAKERGIGMLVITHYSRILRYLKPDAVHILKNGSIVESGSHELAERIEQEGYDAITSRA